MVTYPYAYITYIVSPLAGLGGGISWRPPAYVSLFKFFICRMYCTLLPFLWQNEVLILWLWVLMSGRGGWVMSANTKLFRRCARDSDEWV